VCGKSGEERSGCLEISLEFRAQNIPPSGKRLIHVVSLGFKHQMKYMLMAAMTRDLNRLLP
jgi:hypothetical protein